MSPRASRARAEPASATEPYGYFDGVVDGHATGWCCRPADLSTRLEVEVLVDGEPVGRGTADRRRDAVARAGYGDGRYGFRVPLPEALDDGGGHRIAVRAEGELLPAAPSFIPGQRRSGGEPGDGEPGAWSTTTFVPDEGQDGRKTAGAAPGAVPQRRPDGAERPAAAPAPAKASSAGSASSFTGYIDGIVGGEIVGWVVDRSRPKVPIRIVAMLDGKQIAQTDADVSRGDVKRQGYGDRHGFRLRLPGPLEPGHHTVAVRTVEGSWRVPLAKEYVVMNAQSKPVEDVVLLEAMSGAPPPPPVRGNEGLLGLDGWIFEFATPDFDLVRGATPLEDAVLARHLVRIRERHQLAQTVGAVPIQAVIPARLAVYAEHLPSGLALEEMNRPVNRLLAVVRERNEIDVIDLTAPLRQAKGHGAVFPRTARGLTWLGAFAAYRAIAKELARLIDGLVPRTRDQLSFAELERAGDSLAELPRRVWIGSTTVPAGTAAEDEEHEGQPRLDWSALAAEYAVVPPAVAEVAGPAAAMLRRRDAADRGTAVVVHDGTGERLAPFLAEHFDRTVVVAAGADVDRVTAQVQPRAIIEVVSEAALLRV